VPEFLSAKVIGLGAQIPFPLLYNPRPSAAPRPTISMTLAPGLLAGIIIKRHQSQDPLIFGTSERSQSIHSINTPLSAIPHRGRRRNDRIEHLSVRNITSPLSVCLPARNEWRRESSPPTSKPSPRPSAAKSTSHVVTAGLRSQSVTACALVRFGRPAHVLWGDRSA